MASSAQGRLVTLSNRIPVTVKRSAGQLVAERSSGGLVAAMDPAMRERGGVWVGWPGIQLHEDEDLELDDQRYRLAAVPLTTTQVKNYYHGLSNATLWPLFHSLPERASFNPTEWKHYEKVNQLFAEAAVEAAEPGDIFFVHDYHLMTAPFYIRQLRPDARIVFFLHIPFPPFDVYRILPWSRELLAGVQACDLIGFHCPGYANNFLYCVSQLSGVRVDREKQLIEQGNRTVKVSHFPLGIDYASQEQLAHQARRVFRVDELVVLGVDRLDYTKGIPERILAMERLLKQHPEHREKVTFLQLAVPSRSKVAEYQVLKRQIDELVGRVNGRFGTPSWTPIRYLYRSVSPERLASMYRDAAVALITPLRDGMNLVAKEFVASQVDEPGVLVLSRMAGASERMPEALHVNPYNVDSVVARLHDALTMSAEDRRDRMKALQLRERRYDVHAWLRSILEEVERPADALGPIRSQDVQEWLGEFIDDRRLAIFLDYDGTLAEIAPHPSEATLAPGMHDAIARCVARPDTDVAVVSGRALEDVQSMIDQSGLILAGNHGLEIAGPGIEPYRHPDIAHYEARAKQLAVSLKAIDYEGVWVEKKGASLTLHYRQADHGVHAQIVEVADEMIRDAGFQAREALSAVEARPPIGWDKGHAVLHVLRSCYGPAWSERLRVIYIGDDETDEDAFRALRGLGSTFRVGGADRPTQARRWLSDVASVQRMLEWLGERPETETWREFEAEHRQRQLAIRTATAGSSTTRMR